MISCSDRRSCLRQADVDERFSAADVLENGAVQADVVKPLPLVFPAVHLESMLLNCFSLFVIDSPSNKLCFARARIDCSVGKAENLL
jgi:hypothetical protein